jgi:glycosyltransferase involved in cell wall biosynthesis
MSDHSSTHRVGVAAFLARAARSIAESLRRPAIRRDVPRIAVLCEGLLRYGSSQAIGLAQAGANVTVYYVDRYVAEAASSGVEIVKLPPRDLRRIWSSTRSLVKDLRSRQVDCLIVQEHYDPRFALASLRFPTALMLHDPRRHSGEEATLPWLARAGERVIEATATCVVLHSDRLRTQVRPFLAGQTIVVVPHGTHIANEALPIPTELQLLLFGRMFLYKGLDSALDAFRIIRAERDDIVLTIAGAGPVMADVPGVLPAGVRVIDRYLAEEEVDDLFRQSTLLLLPYRDATQSGVGLAAIGRGLPCIVTNEGALPDLIPSGAASYVVPSGNAVALASAIVANVSHDKLLRQSFLDHASKQFAWHAAGTKMLAELRRVGVLQD